MSRGPSKRGWMRDSAILNVQPPNVVRRRIGKCLHRAVRCQLDRPTMLFQKSHAMIDCSSSRRLVLIRVFTNGLSECCSWTALFARLTTQRNWLPHHSSASASSSSSSGEPIIHSVVSSFSVAAWWKNAKSSLVARKNLRHVSPFTGFTVVRSLSPCCQYSMSSSKRPCCQTYDRACRAAADHRRLPSIL